MPAFGNEKLLFVHIPKTGGSWAEIAMRAAGVRTEREGDDLHPQLNDLERRGRFTLAFVREPVAWYGSHYCYKRGNHGTPHYIYDPLLHLPFPEFLQECTRLFPGRYSRLLSLFVGTPHSPIDFIGYFERLEDDLCRALEPAGQDFDENVLRSVPPINVSSPTPHCPSHVGELLITTERPAYERFYDSVLPRSGFEVRAGSLERC